MKRVVLPYLILVLVVLVSSGCWPQPDNKQLVNGVITQMGQAAPASSPGESSSSDSGSFVLQTGIIDGRMVYLGVGGEIDGKVNPDLVIRPGDAVQLTLINKDGMPHDLSVPDLNVQTSIVAKADTAVEVEFTVTDIQEGAFSYFCTVPGHRQAGMVGTVFVVSSPVAAY